MLYREIIAVCSQIHTKHINTLCGQIVELLHVKLAVHIVTTWLWRVSLLLPTDSTCSYTTFRYHPAPWKKLLQRKWYIIYHFFTKTPFHLGEWQPSGQAPWCTEPDATWRLWLASRYFIFTPVGLIQLWTSFRRLWTPCRTCGLRPERSRLWWCLNCVWCMGGAK